MNHLRTWKHCRSARRRVVNTRLQSSHNRFSVDRFTAHAMIVGSQHFVTFDQKHYDFKGHCSYLLANDFVGHEFSLVMNYESDIIGHYTLLLLLGHETVSIDLQRKVSFGSQRRGFEGSIHTPVASFLTGSYNIYLIIL